MTWRYFDCGGAAEALVGAVAGALSGVVSGTDSKLFVPMAGGGNAAGNEGGWAAGVSICFCNTCFSNSEALFLL